MRALALLFLAAPIVAQTTIEVPRDQPTIQAAVDLSVDGDTILVAPGTYAENVVIDGKDVELRSLYGPTVTVIDGGLLDTTVQLLNGADGSLEGFTITRGKAPSSGGGIRIDQSSPRIHACLVEKNGALSDGGGIQILNGAVRITNCVVRNNGTEYWDGGGVHLAWAAGTVLTHCTIVENHVPFDGWGGGIWDVTGGVTISNCIVRDNYSDWWEWDIGHHPSTRVQYTNFSESSGSNGNIDQPAGFVDQAAGDLHLRNDSACIGAGLANAPAVPPYDMDGNPRGSSVDMGADEYGPAAYVLGPVRPGVPATVRAGGGLPGDPVGLWLDVRLKNQPQSTPWGEWWLENRRIKVLDDLAGPLGWATGTWVAPHGASGRTLFGQGVVGTSVTPVSLVRIK